MRGRAGERRRARHHLINLRQCAWARVALCPVSNLKNNSRRETLIRDNREGKKSHSRQKMSGAYGDVHRAVVQTFMSRKFMPEKDVKELVGRFARLAPTCAAAAPGAMPSRGSGRAARRLMGRRTHDTFAPPYGWRHVARPDFLNPTPQSIPVLFPVRSKYPADEVAEPRNAQEIRSRVVVSGSATCVTCSLTRRASS